MLCFAYAFVSRRILSDLIQFLNFSLIVKNETDLYIIYDEPTRKMQDTVTKESNLVVAEKFLMSCINYREKINEPTN
jgi:hypothetical protein